MKFAKKNSSVIVGIIVFIAVLVGIFTVKSILSSDEPVAFYGTRLEGRKDVEISNDKKNKIKDKLKENKVSIRVAGRIINVTIKVNADTTLDSAKELGNKILEELSDKEKKYYDVQILIENDKNTNQFPIIGYKQHKKENISWTKDRVES